MIQVVWFKSHIHHLKGHIFSSARLLCSNVFFMIYPTRSLVEMNSFCLLVQSQLTLTVTLCLTLFASQRHQTIQFQWGKTTIFAKIYVWIWQCGIFQTNLQPKNRWVERKTQFFPSVKEYRNKAIIRLP